MKSATVPGLKAGGIREAPAPAERDSAVTLKAHPGSVAPRGGDYLDQIGRKRVRSAVVKRYGRGNVNLRDDGQAIAQLQGRKGVETQLEKVEIKTISRRDPCPRTAATWSQTVSTAMPPHSESFAAASRLTSDPCPLDAVPTDPWVSDRMIGGRTPSRRPALAAHRCQVAREQRGARRLPGHIEKLHAPLLIETKEARSTHTGEIGVF